MEKPPVRGTSVPTVRIGHYERMATLIFESGPRRWRAGPHRAVPTGIGFPITRNNHNIFCPYPSHMLPIAKALMRRRVSGLIAGRADSPPLAGGNAYIPRKSAEKRLSLPPTKLETVPMKAFYLSGLLCLLTQLPLAAGSLLVEAEQFSDKGGWQIDTQFIESMGSPYLIAHGLGNPVADASTEVEIRQDGNYRVWVRTIDWSGRLGRAKGAGAFALLIDGQKVGDKLGQADTQWNWELAGTTDLKKGKATLALQDLTGFDGRVDAVLLSSDPKFTPPVVSAFEQRVAWEIRGAPLPVEDAGDFDLVVVGGGYGGLGTAISAARMGVKVALIQNREVLGGNGSSEVRVWAQGILPPSEYPLADIVHEIEDDAKASPGQAEEFVDDVKMAVVQAEKNITLFLGHHAYGLDMDGDAIVAAKMFEIETGQIKRVTGKLFADCTGHGFIAQWAGADIAMAEKGRMGMSNMWIWENQEEPTPFAEKPWMIPLKAGDFPYPRRNHAEWFWESGFDKDPIKELEVTRDYNLLAAYSAWNAIKNHGAHAARDPEAHANAAMTWLAYIGGPRETQQILGDVILTGDEVEAKKPFPDAVVLTTWPIDLHIPHPKYEEAFPEHPFISKAIFRRVLDKEVGYGIPYRCFYSRNVPNLFMAGRNISVDRGALGTIRVMKTIGTMGVTVGRAAAVCVIRDTDPRGIYTDYLEEAKTVWRFPGQQRFENLDELKQFLQPTPADL